MTLRYNKLRDVTGALLEEICHDDANELILQSVVNNNRVLSTTNTNDEARFVLVQKASGLWIRKHFLTSGCLTPTLHDTNLEVSNSALQ